MSAQSEAALASLGRHGMESGIEAASDSLLAYAANAPALAVAFSGGKDSTALALVVEYVIQQGVIRRPRFLYLIQVNTGVELPPLCANSTHVSSELRKRGWITICRKPKPRERLWVQMLGRGLPPANSNFWWCTRSTKKAPQDRLYAKLRRTHPEMLVLYGSRIDESDARAERIAASCLSAGTECGLSLYRKSEKCLAPLVGWRNCAVWDWLMVCNRYIGIDVPYIWEAYSPDGDQQRIQWKSWNDDERDEKAAEWDAIVEASARTGCVACHIARDDRALIRLCRSMKWGHLRPYLRLRCVVDALRMHEHRVVRPSKGCAGAVKLESRLWALEKVLLIQDEVRSGAEHKGVPHCDLIPPEDECLIRRLIAEQHFPGTAYSRDPEPMPLHNGNPLVPLSGQQELFESTP